MTIPVRAVADYFIRRVDRESGDDITHLKLQKLLYYAQAWHLAMHGNRLFDESFEAWMHGPVCRSVYEQFRHLSRSPIPLSAVQTDEGVVPTTMREFLDEVWEVYGQYSASKLEQMTHDEAPWLEARKGVLPGNPSQRPISETTMTDYYASRMVARKRIRAD